MTKHYIASTEELDDGDRLFVEIEGTEIAVFCVEGSYHAVLNYCVHQSGPLCEGGLSGRLTAEPPEFDWSYDDEPRVITCPWHNWKFDIQTGKNIRDDEYKVPIFETTVEDGEIYLHW